MYLSGSVMFAHDYSLNPVLIEDSVMCIIRFTDYSVPSSPTEYSVQRRKRNEIIDLDGGNPPF